VADDSRAVPHGRGIERDRGRTRLRHHINASVSEVLSHLEFGAMDIVAARKGAWVIGADVVYVELSAMAERPPANVDFDQTALAFHGAHSLGSAVEARFGLRINRTAPLEILVIDSAERPSEN